MRRTKGFGLGFMCRWVQIPARRVRAITFVAVTSLLVALTPFVALPASAAPVIGGQLYSTGVPVRVTVLPASAGYTSELWLFEPGPARRLATNRDVGNVVDLEPIPAGTEMVFGTKVLNTGDEFRMGPGSRNGDGLAHAVVDFQAEGHALVGFEDLFGGGDRDYNDNVFDFQGGITPVPDQTPRAAAGPDQHVPEGSLVRLDGNASTDPDGNPLTYSWAVTSHTGPPVALSDPTSPAPTFRVPDDGSYSFTLEVSDGSHTASDAVTVTVINANPALTLSNKPAYARGAAVLNASVTDAGFLDTHTAVVDWGDGTPAAPANVDAAGAGWASVLAAHSYPKPGNYPVTMTVTDDDGGIVTAGTSLQIVEPIALWANSTTITSAVDWTASKVVVAGRVHTNGDLRIRGSDKTFVGSTEFVGALDLAGGGATFTPAAKKVAVEQFPIRYVLADYRPGGRAASAAGSAFHDMTAACTTGGAWQVDEQNLDDGLYYANCAVRLTGHSLAGRVTIVAEGPIHIAGSSARFDPFMDGLLFASSSTVDDAIKFSTSGSRFVGYTFTEHGGIALSGSGDSFFCGLLADRVRISAQNLTITASGCAQGAPTTLPPLLVPHLSLSLTTDPANGSTALPGQPVTHTVRVTNDKAALVVTGVIGVENLTARTVTATGANLVLQRLDAVSRDWVDLPNVQFAVHPIQSPGATFPGLDAIQGGSAGPRGLLAGAYRGTTNLDPEMIAELEDPTRTSGLRVRAAALTSPVDAAVRQLSNGDDLLAAYRVQSADATDINVNLSTVGSAIRTFTAGTTPALSRLSPGQGVTLTAESAIPAVAARGKDETASSYLARLRAVDNNKLLATSNASAQATVGLILTDQSLSAVTRVLPVLNLKVTSPAEVRTGTDATWAMTTMNVGHANATGMNLSSDLATALVITPEVPTEVAPGAEATFASTYAVPAAATGSLAHATSVVWKDSRGSSYGPVDQSDVTRLLSPARLALTKTAAQSLVQNGTQRVLYEVAVTNTGDTAVSDVAVNDPLDPYTTLDSGTLTTTNGSTGGSGTDRVQASIPTLPGHETALISFWVQVDAVVPSTVTTIANQATVTATGLPPVPSDDPGVPGATDSTITPVAANVGLPATEPTPGEETVPDPGLPRPSISLASPTDGARVTSPVNVAANLVAPDGQTITRWRITVRPADTVGATDRVLAQGVGNPPPPGTLNLVSTLAASSESGAPSTPVSATLDPSVLPNGTWLVTVAAEASGGGLQASTTSVLVDGQLKLGRYVSAARDLSVRIGATPVDVVRTYDTLALATGARGDLAPGWQADIASVRVSVNRPMGYRGWKMEPGTCGLVFCMLKFTNTAPHYSTVTWPDGHQDVFDLVPTEGSTFFTGLTSARFVARPGSTGTLEAIGDTGLMFTGDGNLYTGFGGGGVFDPRQFKLTTRDGTVYEIDRSKGLISLTPVAQPKLISGPGGLVDAAGKGITYVRDSTGRITEIRGPAGEKVTYGFNAAGDLSVVTGPGAGGVTYGYDTNHYLTSVKDDGGHTLRTLEYQDGRLAAVVNADGTRSTLSLDQAGRQETLTDATGKLTTTSTYDDDGDLLREDHTFDGRTLTTRYTYDALGNPTSVTDPLGHISTAKWNSNGDLLEEVDAEARKSSYTYNAAGNPLTVAGPDGATATTITYTQDGQPATQKNADGSVLTYTYDPDTGRLLGATGPKGRALTYGYDADGRVNKVTDNAGTTAGYTYDASGRTRTVTDNAGTTTLTRDGAGNILTVDDPSHQVTRYTYDAFDRPLTLTEPSGKTSTWTFTPEGYLARTTDGTGATVTYDWDAAGRLTEVKPADGRNVHYDYDPLGRMTQATGPDAIADLTWDDGDRLTATRTRASATSPQPDVTIGHTYDKAGVVTGVGVPAGPVEYGYDSRGRLATIGNQQLGEFTLGFDQLDRLNTLTRPNTVNDTLAWDGQDLASRDATKGTTVLSRAEYTFDSIGRRTSLTDTGGVHTYTRNDRGQLTGVDHPGNRADETYGWDPFGNRTADTTSPQGTNTTGPSGRLAEDSVSAYTYDGEGRLTQARNKSTGDITTYTWSTQGQLLKVARPGGSTSTYRYDPFGRRIEVNDNARITRYAWDDANIVGEYDDANQLTAAFVTTPQPGQMLGVTRPDGTHLYPLVDGLGSVTALTDSAGAVVGRYEYDAYGSQIQAPTGAGTEVYTFAGQQYDATTGLYSMRSRYYDPAHGRFISPDPVAANNQYWYAEADPVDMVDVFGETSSVEYSSVSSLSRGVALAVRNNGGAYLCGHLVQAAIACLRAGDFSASSLGQGGERHVRNQLGANVRANTQTFTIPGSSSSRRPDLVMRRFLGEVKNSGKVYFSSQISDTLKLAKVHEKTYVVFIRASTFQKLVNSPFYNILNRATKRSGLAVVGCLPG